MFWLPNVTFFHSNLLSDNSVSFTSSRMKVLCPKWKVKLIFRGAYRPSGTGIVECLEIIDVGCNPKQLDGLIDPDPLRILRQIYGTEMSFIYPESLSAPATRFPLNAPKTCYHRDSLCGKWKPAVLPDYRRNGANYCRKPAGFFKQIMMSCKFDSLRGSWK